MEISEERKADLVILGLSGKLDATTVKTFEDKILAEIDSGDRRFVIDLSQLDYVSSAGTEKSLSVRSRITSTRCLIFPASHRFLPFTVREKMGSKVCNVLFRNASPQNQARRAERPLEIGGPFEMVPALIGIRRLLLAYFAHP